MYQRLERKLIGGGSKMRTTSYRPALLSTASSSNACRTQLFIAKRALWVLSTDLLTFRRNYCLVPTERGLSATAHIEKKCSGL